VKGLLRTGFNASTAFYAIRFILNLVYRKLHGTDLLALLAIYALVSINFELVFTTTQRLLKGTHGAE